MSPGSGRSPRSGSVVHGIGLLARLVLAALWLAEGAVKVHARFGAADIGLVVDGAGSNPRVPEVFVLFAEHVMAPLSGLFGIGIPVLELALGAGLALGHGTRLLALASTGTLALYWMSDQLVVQYPVMMLLGAVVLSAARSRGAAGARGAGGARAPRPCVGPSHR